MKSPQKLPRSFYARPTLEVAPDLLGKFLVYNTPEQQFIGEINEVEAYLGQEDPASHAFRGPTPRTQVMFGEAGHVYVYQIYGLHYCMNVVTEQNGVAGAVLIRSIIPIKGISFDQKTDGPAKLCKVLGINRAQNGLDLVTSDLMHLSGNYGQIKPFMTSPRIGITKAADKMWRFYYEIE